MIYVSDQDIKKLMAKRKRELATVKRSFPKYTPGMSTADYVAKYIMANYSGMAIRLSGNNLLEAARQEAAGYFEPLNIAPATVPSGPDVIEEPAE